MKQFASAETSEHKKNMIAILLVAIAAPILALPVSENVQHQQQQQAEQYPVQQQQFPSLVPGVYSFSEFISPKGKSAVVQVPIEPDALVIPYPASKTFNTPYPFSQYSQSPNQYPEPFLIVPVHNIQKISPFNYAPHNFHQGAQLLYYLPKSYHNHQQQQQYQQYPQQVQPVHPQAQKVVQRSLQPEAHIEQVQPQVQPAVPQVVQKNVLPVAQAEQAQSQFQQTVQKSVHPVEQAEQTQSQVQQTVQKSVHPGEWTEHVQPQDQQIVQKIAQPVEWTEQAQSEVQQTVQKSIHTVEQAEQTQSQFQQIVQKSVQPVLQVQQVVPEQGTLDQVQHTVVQFAESAQQVQN